MPSCSPLSSTGTTCECVTRRAIDASRSKRRRNTASLAMLGLDDLQRHMLLPGSDRFVHTAHAPGAHERLDAIRAHELARAQFVGCVLRLGVVLVQLFLSACLGPRLVIELGEEKSA